MCTYRKNHEAIFVFIFLQIAAFCDSTILSTNSRWIVDNSTGNRVKLTCVNWPSHMEYMIAEGLEKKPLNYIAKQIVEFGFNCVRFTWATYMFTRPDYGNLKVSESLDKWNLTVAKAGFARNNPELLNMTVVELHAAVVNELGKNKVMVVLDNHVSRPGWCCDWNDANAFFEDDDFRPGEWLQGLAAVATAYKGNAAVVGVSLRNELRGNRQNKKDWYHFMQEGGETVHRENRDLLVIVSGLSFARELGFIKSQPLAVSASNKLVYEAHWYSFGTTADKWAAQTNQLCASITKSVGDNAFFVTAGDNPVPLFLSEFGVNQNGDSEVDNRYISCSLATIAETDIDWALWSLQGSYMLRQGTFDLEEIYGVFDLKWDRLRNPDFIQRLRLVRQMNQDLNTTNPTYYKMFHPLSGQCVQMSNKGIAAGSCSEASQWEKHEDGGIIKLSGSPRCLGVAGDGLAARVLENCSSSWKFASSTSLHLASKDGEGKYLCLEKKNASDPQIVTKKCLCVGDDLADLPTCADNPQPQWFKLVPANVHNKAIRNASSIMWGHFMIVILILIYQLV